MDTSHWRGLLAQVFGGRDWILAADVLVSLMDTAQSLRELGAGQMLCIGAARGAGALPDAPLGPEPIVLGVEAGTLMGGIHASLDALARLPPDAVARVDAFDPDRALRVIGTIFDDGRPVAGRAKFGARAASWQRLEDKTLIEPLWRALGVPCSPSRVVPAAREALAAAHAALDLGDGTVWAGDNREGFHGAASGTRWVRGGEDLAVTARWAAARFDRVRVMPFLEGVPCSIHGVVFDDYVIALRPCEMLVFRRPGDGRFHYAGAATFWDPPQADREAMRGLAKRVGEGLRARVGYRGAFTIDGVMTAEGFRPTELNPRFGAALAVIARGLTGLDLKLLNVALVEHPALDWRPRALEGLLLESADSDRGGGPSMFAEGERRAGSGAGALKRDASGWRFASEAEVPDASYIVGPGAAGVYANVRFSPHALPVGPSAAPESIRALRDLSQLLDLPLSALEPAKEVRR